jgi:hypothetical protein
MSKLLYPHLTVIVDTKPCFIDLTNRYSQATDNKTISALRKEMVARSEYLDKWLVKHGYQCGQDYQRTSAGYRFATEQLATFFRLAWYQ